VEAKQVECVYFKTLKWSLNQEKVIACVYIQGCPKSTPLINYQKIVLNRIKDLQ